MNFLPKETVYPKQIYVANETYKVIFDKNLDCYGITDSAKKTITLKAGMSKRSLFITFIHELLHVLEFEHNIRLRHKTVYKLERGLSELLFDNFIGGKEAHESDEYTQLRINRRCKPSRAKARRPRKNTRRNVRKTDRS